MFSLEPAVSITFIFISGECSEVTCAIA